MAAFSAQAGASFSVAAAGQPMGQSGLRKARFVCRELGEELEVHFNPTQLTIQKGVVVARPHQRGAPTGSETEYLNTHTRSLDFMVVLDHWSSKRDVAQDVAMLQNWLNPTQASRDAHRPAPATIEFDWNGPSTFPGYLNSANATYTLFDAGGTPLRASVTISIQELPEPAPAQNPTSGSEPGYRTRLLRDGDTLQSVAYAEYRDAGLWRALARSNGIHDPLRLRPGTRMQVPPIARAREQ